MEAIAENGASEQVIRKPNAITQFFYNKFPYLKTLTHPGRIDDTTNEAKGIVNDDTNEGLKLDLTFGASEHFETSHQLNVFTKTENSRVPRYSYQATYHPPNTLLYAKLDSERRLFGRIDYSFYNDSIKLSASNSMEKDLKSGLCGEAEFKLPFANVVAKIDNEKTTAFSIFSAISKKHSFGFEKTILGLHNVSIVALHYNQRSPSLKSNFHFQIQNNGQISADYVYRYQHLQVATELLMGLTQEGKIASEFSFGFRYYFRTNLVKFKADTSGNLHGSYDQMINQLLKLNLCTSINYFTNEFKYGVGLAFSK